MSLDFILIKSHGYPLCMDDIEVDSQFGAADYKKMADRFFGPVDWTGETGIAIHDEMSFELKLSGTSLHVTVRGPGDRVAFIDNVAALAIKESIATVDVQGSELLLPIND